MRLTVNARSAASDVDLAIMWLYASSEYAKYTNFFSLSASANSSQYPIDLLVMADVSSHQRLFLSLSAYIYLLSLTQSNFRVDQSWRRVSLYWRWHNQLTVPLLTCLTYYQYAASNQESLLHSNCQISLWQTSNQSSSFFGKEAHLDRRPHQRRARATFWPDWIRRRWRSRTVRIDHRQRLRRHHQREHVSARTSATKSAYVKFRRRLI